MSGAFSNVVNFSVFDFVQRAGKLCLLQSMKTESEYVSSLQSVRFPTQHKQGRSSSSSSTSSIPFSLTTSDTEEVVQRAFRDACDLIKPLNVNEMLHKNGYRTLARLSNFIRKQLNASKLSPQSSQFTDQQGDEEEEEGSDSSTDNGNESESGEECDLRAEDSNEESFLDLSNTSFKEMRIFESLDASKVNSYFKVSRGGDLTYVYVNKQTACWYLMGDKPTLSADRSNRVMQSSNKT